MCNTHEKTVDILEVSGQLMAETEFSVLGIPCALCGTTLTVLVRVLDYRNRTKKYIYIYLLFFRGRAPGTGSNGLGQHLDSSPLPGGTMGPEDVRGIVCSSCYRLVPWQTSDWDTRGPCPKPLASGS